MNAEWNSNNLQSSFTDDTSNNDDDAKWERMYYSQQTPQYTDAQSQTPSSSSSIASDVRIITFDLDNTLWKTGPTISHANTKLNAHLHSLGVKRGELVEVEMGRLFGLNKQKYAGDNYEDNEDGGDVAEKEGADAVVNVGETDEDDGVIGSVHIRAVSKKKKVQPVYLTMLRKDAIRSLLQYNTSTPMSQETLESEVDSAFRLWMDARTHSITRNLASNTLSTLSKLRSCISSTFGKVYIGAITDGNSNPLLVPDIGHYFDFVIRAEDVGVSKPDVRVYKAAVGELMATLTRDGISVENFFLGGESNGPDDAAAYMKAPLSRIASWKDVDEEAIEAFSDAVGPWWVHVGDDFFKDVVASKTFRMRSVWVQELLSKKTKVEDERAETKQTERTVKDLENEIAKHGVLRMTIGESEFLKTSLHEEFSDAILDRFEELSDLLVGWHEDGLREQQQAAHIDKAAFESYSSMEFATHQSQFIQPTIVDNFEPSSQTDAPDRSDASNAMDRKFCVFCGNQLPAVAKFCSGCGEKQPS